MSELGDQSKYTQLFFGIFDRFFSSSLRKIAAVHFSWLLFEKIMRIFSGLLIGAYATRYLGPDNIGKLAYIISITSIYQALLPLGMDLIGVRLMSRKSSISGRILGTLLTLRLLSGLVCFLSMLLTIYLFVGPDANMLELGALASFGVLFQFIDVIGFWFLARHNSKSWALSRSWALFLIGALKLLGVVQQYSLNYFAALLSIEVLISAIFLLSQFLSKSHSIKLQWNSFYAQLMLKEGFPVMCASIVTALYLQSQRLILAKYSIPSELGIFSIASTLFDYLCIPSFLLCNTLFPILSKKRTDEAQDFIQVRAVLTIVVVSLFMVLAALIFGDFVIKILYGSAYKKSSEVLSILAVGIFFSSFGLLADFICIGQNKSYLIFIRTFISLILSIALGVLIIPEYGSIGAAYISVCLNIVVNFLFIPMLVPTLFGNLKSGLVLIYKVYLGRV